MTTTGQPGGCLEPQPTAKITNIWAGRWKKESGAVSLVGTLGRAGRRALVRPFACYFPVSSLPMAHRWALALLQPAAPGPP